MGSGKYVIVTETGGLDIRTIASIMTCGGDSMGHATVRNILLHVMERFACALMGRYGALGDPSRVAADPTFQVNLANVIQDIVSARSDGGMGSCEVKRMPRMGYDQYHS